MWLSLRTCALLVTLQVMSGCLLVVAQVDSCYLSRYLSVGQRICSFVLDGYDIELISPKDDFKLQHGNLILARDTLFRKEMVESVDLRLRLSGGDCQWETNVPLQVVRQKHVEGNQRYHLWPQCPHLQQRRRTKREVNLQETSITVSENTTVGTVVHTVRISQPPSSGPYTFALEGTDLKFEIDETLGTLTLTTRLDGQVDPIESFIVIIANADIGDITREQFTVFVTSQAVLTWTMRAFPYLAVVPADAPNDACIYQLNAVADEEAEINYFLRTTSDLTSNAASGLPTDRFRVDQTSGCVFTVVTASSPLFKTENEFILSVYAVDVSTVDDDRHELNAEVRVFGVEHPPQFTQEMYQATVEEHVAGQQTVIQVEAYSFNIKLAVTYSLNPCPSPCPDHSIDSETGLITLLTENLDRELLASYFLTVNAQENTDGGFTTTVRVNVAVVDKNDCAPEFVGISNLYRNVPEMTTDIFQLPVTDCDIGPNGQLNYTLTGTGAPYFYVDDDGFLYSFGNLDFDRIIPPRYTFTIEASDMGVPPLSSSIDVIVEVTAENDEVPEFNPDRYSYIIDENFNDGSGIEIGAVYANDPDRPPQLPDLSYSIDGPSSFSVDSTTGVVTFTPAMPLESSYTVTVKATSGGDEVTTNFDVSLNDINNHAPEFSNCMDASISEAAGRDDVVITVTATDEDSGQNGEVTYSLEPGNTPFRIESETGLITVKQSGSLDRETIPSYLITVIARDNSQKVPQLEGFCDLTISLTDVNDETPQFGLTASQYRTAITKDFTASEPVVVVAAEDPDLGTTLTYTLDDEQYFKITPTTGEIYFKQSSDLPGNLVNLQVTANDSVQASSIDIQIQFIEEDYFDAPMWNTYCDGGAGCCSVSETVQQGEQVLLVQAASSSSDPSIVYSLLRGARPETNSLNSFTLRSVNNFTQAEILVGSGELDYETVSRITLEISAKNKGQNSLQDTTSITFCIEDANDNPPTFLQDNYDAFVSESAGPNTPVITLSAGDLDASPEFRVQEYSIVPGEPDSDEFTINEATGEIRNSRKFDREQDKEIFIINVIARNVEPLAGGGANEAQATVSIYILDENDFQPFFNHSSYSATISGYAEIGEELITVTAIDEDPDSMLQYFISAGNTDGTFTVNHVLGRITVARRLPVDVSSFSLTYNVNDGLASSQTTIDVAVDPPMRAWPEFNISDNSYTAELTENNRPPNKIVTVNILPEDPSYTYSLLSENSPFEIDSLTGVITVTSALDRENVPVWYLVTMATKDSQIAYAGVTVNVIDINDSPPDYPLMEYVDTVDEDAVADTSVMSMKAEDGDDDFALLYEIECIPPDPDNCVFDIDPSSGEILYNGAFELMVPGSFYEVLVTARDGEEEASATATIYVKDVDNHFPAFKNGIGPFTVGDDAAIGETVGVLPVEDPDEDFRASVQFSIIDGNDDNLFDIYSDPFTLQGVIVVAKELDGVTSQPFTLTVEVKDQDFVPSGSETTFVSVTVMSVEEPPKFIGDFPLEVSVQENTQLILTLEITDDEGDTFRVSVFPDEEFTVALSTGNYYSLRTKLANGLDRETRDEYEVVVTATEEKVGGLSSSVTIKITVEEVDDEAPYFESIPKAVVDPENQGEQLVVELRALDDDLDSSEPGYLLYELLTDIDGMFVLVPNTQDNSASIIKNQGQLQNYDIDLSVAITDKAGNRATFQIPVEEYTNVDPHAGASKIITVYSFEGNIPTSPIGTVPVSDGDVFEDKNYQFKGSYDYFTLDSDSGLLTIRSGTPSGTYNLEVTITDDGIGDVKYDAVDSSIEVIVRDVSREAVVNSGSIRFSTPNAEVFASETMRGTLQSSLANILGVAPSDVDIFSIIPSPGGEGTDVRYSVSSTSSRKRRSVRQLLAISNAFYTAEYVDAKVLGQLSDSDWVVQMVSIDECIPNDCIRECSSVLTIDETPVVINTPEFSFVSVNSYEVAECSCAVKSTPIGGCLDTTCRNGGTCIPLDSGDVGYKCSCRSGFEGPECQRLAATFDGQQYAWLETLSQCEESHTSLEFLTSSASGILFYNGPIRNDDDTSDFMLLQLVNGEPELRVNFGDGLTILSIGLSLDDGVWHKIDIFRSGKSIEMVVDSCGNEVVTEEFNLSELQDENSCRISGILQGSFPIFECNRPLQLGGVEDRSPNNIEFSDLNFNGCIKNVIDNGKLYDLEINDAGSQSPPVGGCASVDSACFVENNRPYCVNGVCDTSTSEVSCICHAGWSGPRCNSDLSEYDFAEESYVLYDLSSVGNIDRSVSDYYVTIRTRQKEDALIWTIANENTYEHITLQMVDGFLQASWHLGDTTVYDSLPNYPLNNGEWHGISFQRKNNFVTVKVDGGGGVREFSNQESQFRMLDVDRMSLKVGAMVVREVVVSKNLLGCAQDVRFNGQSLDLINSGDAGNAVSYSQGVTLGCFSDACGGNPCNGTYQCFDIWRKYECRPPITCDDEPCKNGGICTDVEPVGFECECPDGYIGTMCEIISEPVVNPLELSAGAIIAITICLLFLIILLLMLVVCKRKVDEKYNRKILSMNYHSTEDFTAYDEEGEEGDTNAYDLSVLVKPEGDRFRNPEEETEVIIRPVEEPLVEAERIKPAKTAVTFQPNVGDYLIDRINEEDNKSENGPQDETLEFQYEGDGSSAGSISSLNSSSTGASEQDFSYLQDLGPPFKRLADIYGSEEREPSVRLSFSSTDA